VAPEASPRVVSNAQDAGSLVAHPDDFEYGGAPPEGVIVGLRHRRRRRVSSAGGRAAASMTGRPAGGGISTWAPPSCRWRPRMRRLDGRRCGRVRFHTEQGSEYSARVFRAACDRLDITQSMGRPGSAVDNAVIEVLALHPRVRAAARRELPDHNRGPPGGGGMDRRLQPGPPPLLDRHDLPDRVRAQPRPGSRRMTRLRSRSRGAVLARVEATATPAAGGTPEPPASLSGPAERSVPWRAGAAWHRSVRDADGRPLVLLSCLTR